MADVPSGRSGDFVELPPTPGQSETYHQTNLLYTPWYLPFKIIPFNIEWAILLISLSYFPLVALIASFALRNIDPRLEDSARMLYGQGKVFWKVTLPLILPHIAISGLLVFIFSVTELDITSILSVWTLVMEVFIQAGGFFDINQAIAVSIPLVISTILFILIIHLVLGRRSFITISSYSSKPNLIGLKPSQKIICLAFILLVMLLSSFIPLVTLLIKSKFMFLAALDKAGDSIINTIFLAGVTSCIMVALGLLLAYFSSRRMDPVILFPLAVPSAVIGISLIRTFNNDATGFIYGSFLILIMGYFARYIPFVIKTLSPFFEQIHPSIEESARLNKASFLMILRHIILPLMKPGMIVAWIVGFVLCLRELTISILLSPPGVQTLSNRIFTLYHYGETETVASLSIILILLILSPVILFMAGRGMTKWRLLK